MPTIELEIEDRKILSDGYKFLIYFLRKNKWDFPSIQNLLLQNFKLDIPIPTIRSIFISINNRLTVSTAYRHGDINYVAIKSVFDMITQEALLLLEKKYLVAIRGEILPNSSPKHSNSYRHYVRLDGKKLNLELTIVFNPNGLVWAYIKDFKNDYHITYDNAFKILIVLANLENTIFKILEDD